MVKIPLGGPEWFPITAYDPVRIVFIILSRFAQLKREILPAVFISLKKLNISHNTGYKPFFIRVAGLIIGYCPFF
jgi:hypothetical protein